MKNFFSIMLFLGFVCVVAFTTEQQIFAENQSLKDTVYSNDESNQNITYVSSWDEFEKAITNSEVTYIRLTQDISYPSTRPENIVLTYRNNRLRSLVIDGNTHKIDLNKRARISLDGNGPIREGFDIEFKIKNIDIVNGSRYGFIAAYGIQTARTSNNRNYGNGTFTYENMTYSGSQFQYAPGFDTEINNSVKLEINDGLSDGAIIQTSGLTVREKSSLTIDSYASLTNSVGLINFANVSNSGMELKEGSKVNISHRGTMANNTNLMNFGTNANQYIKLKQADLTVDTQNMKDTINTETSNIISMNANAIIETVDDAHLTINSKVSPTNSNNANGYNNTITMGNNATVLIGTNSAWNIETNYNNSDIANYTARTSLLSLGSDSILNIEENATLNMKSNMNNRQYSNLVDLGRGSQFKLTDSELVNLELTSEETSFSRVIDFSTGSTFEFTNQTINALNNELSSRGSTNLPSRTGYGNFDRLNWGELEWNGLKHVFMAETNNFVTSSASTSISSSSNAKMVVENDDDAVKSSFISNFNPAFYKKLSFKKYNKTVSDANVRDVYTFNDLIKAMLNVSVTEINIKKDLEAGDVANNNETRIMTGVKGMKVNGNGHNIELKSYNFYNDMNIPSNINRRIIFSDMNITGACFYGLYDSWGSINEGGKADFVYQDITYTGAQLTSSLYQDINFANVVKVDSVPSYVSPVNGNIYSSQGSGQENVEARDIKFLDGAKYYGTANSSDVIFLRDGGSVSLGKKAEVHLTSVSTNSDNSYPTNRVNSNEVIYLPGSLYCEQDAQLFINTRSDSAQMAINMPSRSSNINLSKNSSLRIQLSDTGVGRGFSTSDRPVIEMNNNASLTVDSEAKLEVLGTYKRSRSSVISASNRSQFQINSQGIFVIDLQGEFKGPRTSNQVLNMNANTSFSFNDAKKVDINLQSIAGNFYLFKTAGTFEAQNTKVKAWNTKNISDKPNYDWQSIYNLVPVYNSGNINSVQATGGSKARIDDLKNNYRTQNFNRVLFEGYPDISITLAPVTTESTNLKGNISPNTYVKFIDSSKMLPKGKLQLNELDDSYYNLQIHDDQVFSYNLPNNTHLKEGDEVTAQAFDELSGKVAIAKQIVTGKLQTILAFNKLNDFDFGEHELSTVAQIDKVQFKTKENQNIIVKRNNVKNWKILVSFDDFTNNGRKLNADFLFNNQVYKPNTVFTYYEQKNEEPVSGDFIINTPPDKGIKMQINTPNVLEGEYKSKVSWTLVDGLE